MNWVQGKLKNMDIISAGMYESDGQYNQIKGAKLNYIAPQKRPMC